MHGPGMFFGMFSFFIGLGLTALVVWVIISLVTGTGPIGRKFGRRGGPAGFSHPHHPGEGQTWPTAPAAPPVVDPLAILDERLARGDIDVDDYHARRSALFRNGGQPPQTGASEPGGDSYPASDG